MIFLIWFSYLSTQHQASSLQPPIQPALVKLLSLFTLRRYHPLVKVNIMIIIYYYVKGINGLTLGQYQTNTTAYRNVLIAAISKAFDIPALIQILSVVNGQTQSSTGTIYASYRVQLSSIYPASYFQSQLSSYVSSGAFSNNLQSFAWNTTLTYQTVYFYSASSTSVTTGNHYFPSIAIY